MCRTLDFLMFKTEAPTLLYIFFNLSASNIWQIIFSNNKRRPFYGDNKYLKLVFSEI